MKHQGKVAAERARREVTGTPSLHPPDPREANTSRGVAVRSRKAVSRQDGAMSEQWAVSDELWGIGQHEN